jgi:tetratricopeptide (TPR) repeat protein
VDHQNEDAYGTIGWILNHSEDGFFFLIAPGKVQQEVVERYSGSNVAIYDYKKEQNYQYTFRAVEEFINANAQAGAYFLLNLQLTLQNDIDIQRLNFSRDMLDRLKKNIIFCVTQQMDDTLAKSAFDFYSYIKLRIFFQEESDESDIEDHHLTLKGFDLSSGVDSPDEIDFTRPRAYLLSLAISFSNQAKELSTELRYSDAMVLYQRALAIRERLLGIEHPDTAETYNNIAIVYETKRDYVEALMWYAKALAINEKVLGAEHPSTATIYNNIAEVYYNQGDYAKALMWYEKALAIRKKVLGVEHPSTAATYNNIAGVYYNQGDYVKALMWYKKALAIREKVLGAEHPDTATIYHSIALVCSRHGDYDNALE